MFKKLSRCFYEMIAAMYMPLYDRFFPRENPAMDSVLDTLWSRQVHTEIQDRRCLAEARRLRGNKTMFRAKMLEHRRLQAQLAQLQRYRENVQAQQDAISNHEINQTFVQAMQSAVRAHKLAAYTKDDANTTMEALHESIGASKEMTELLGQPLGEDVLDDDLEMEFMELAGDEQPPIVAVADETTALLEEPIPMPPPRILIPLAAA